MLKGGIVGISSGGICQHVYGQMRSKLFTFLCFHSKPVLALEMIPVEDSISWYCLYLFSESCGHYQKHDFAGINVSTNIPLLVGQAAHAYKLPTVSSPGKSHNGNQNSVKLSTQDIVTVFRYRQQLCRCAIDNRLAKSGVLPAACLCLLTLHALASP